MDTIYYHILDLNMVGKKEAHIPYLFSKGGGWVVDNEHIVDDRVIGYDGEMIGCTDMLFRIEEISEEKANKLIGGIENG